MTFWIAVAAAVLALWALIVAYDVSARLKHEHRFVQLALRAIKSLKERTDDR